MKPVDPILITDLFPLLHVELMHLLRGLSPSDWVRPTACTAWTVHDVAAHLLQGDIRRLSGQRDHYQSPHARQIASYTDLLAYLNASNREWISAADEMSPQVIIDFLALTGPQVCDLFANLDPFMTGLGVMWAGEAESPNWFDTAREFTEKWHHQQHIREAVAAPGLVSRQFLHPVLDTFLRGLPHAYRHTSAPEGTAVAVMVSGAGGGTWTLRRQLQSWRLYQGTQPSSTTTLECSDDSAWRFFTAGLSGADARHMISATGDPALAEPFFQAVGIMA